MAMASLWLFQVSTACSVLSAFIQIIINYIFSVIYKESSKSRGLRREMMDIRKEMSQFSMLDEFARHARLQRKLIKLRQEWKTEANAQNSAKTQTKFIAAIALQIILGLVTLILINMYRYEPVLQFPAKWFSPFSSLLSWPTGEDGAISLLSWLLISGSASRQLASLFS